MYVGKNPFCFAQCMALRPCAEQNSRVIFSEFRKIQRKLPARSPCRKRAARPFSTDKKPGQPKLSRFFCPAGGISIPVPPSRASW